MTTGLVRKIIKSSGVDGPGNRSAVFFQGCNMNCLYCHNPETIPLRADEAKVMTAEQVFAEIGSALCYIRGITVSGGECTLQRDFVLELFKAAKALSLTTLIDTNGLYSFNKDFELLDYTDGVMLDVKSTDDAEHRNITGMSNKKVLSNLEFLAEAGKLYEVRTVLSRQLMDCERTVSYVSEFIGGQDKYSQIKYKLIKYRQAGVINEKAKALETPDDDFIEEMKRICGINKAINIIIV